MTIDAHLRTLEERLLQPNARRGAEELSFLLAEDFREFGSSGTMYNKQQTMEALRTGGASPLIIEDFRVFVLGAASALVTYVARSPDAPGIAPGTPGAASLRSSVWIEREDRWQMLFHQGTKRDAG